MGLIFPFMSTANLERIGDAGTQLSIMAPVEFPYILQFSNSVHHSSWLTQKSLNLMGISGKQVICIHPKDAMKEGIVNGQLARIGSEAGTLSVTVRATSCVNKGELLLINSFSDSPANRLMTKGRPATFVSVGKV
jgi:anaerobic selenocysteine-containing dehydrogenase